MVKTVTKEAYAAYTARVTARAQEVRRRYIATRKAGQSIPIDAKLVQAIDAWIEEFRQLPSTVRPIQVKQARTLVGLICMEAGRCLQADLGAIAFLSFARHAIDETHKLR